MGLCVLQTCTHSPHAMVAALQVHGSSAWTRSSRPVALSGTSGGESGPVQAATRSCDLCVMRVACACRHGFVLVHTASTIVQHCFA